MARRFSLVGGLFLQLGFLPGLGCSFVFVDGPQPASAKAMQVECTTSRVLPILDSIAATVQVLRIGYALAASDADYDQLQWKISRGWDIGTGAALLGLFGTSAVVGFSRVSDCREAKSDESIVEATRYGDSQVRELRRQRLLNASRRLEDDGIREAFAGRVVRSCWLKPATGSDKAPPCVLEGDFDGDGRPDTAVLVAETADPKRRGIALLTSDAARALMGAGTAVGNGGADFAWMDAWRVLGKGETSRMSRGAAGDGLVVEQAESAGGLISIVDGSPHWTQWGD